MKTDNKSKLVVKVGDRIVIEARGRRVAGLVTYVDSEPWDIELTDANISGGYSHWKQESDGGNIVEVNGLDY